MQIIKLAGFLTANFYLQQVRQQDFFGLAFLPALSRVEGAFFLAAIYFTSFILNEYFLLA